MSNLVNMRMDEKQKNFWIGTGIGAVIIIIIDLLISFLAPFIGGSLPVTLRKETF